MGICSSIRRLRSISTRSGIVGCVGARSRLISRDIRARRGIRSPIIRRRRVLSPCRVLRELRCDTFSK